MPTPDRDTESGLHGEREKGKPGVEADRLGGELIDRERVAKRRLAGVDRAGEKTLASVMVAIHFGMRHPGEDGELAAMVGEQVEVGARRHSGRRAGLFLLASLVFLGKEKLRHHAERHVDRDQALMGGSSLGPRGTAQARQHRVQKRQADAGPGCPQERPPREPLTCVSRVA